MLYPLAQFVKRDGVVVVRDGVLRMLEALREQDSWTVAVLLHTPAAELDGLTPLQWMREGRPVEVLAEYAKVLRRELSR
ncbi:hypothetical protein [Nocardioides abyssi]|uniref:DUF2384 domain-containing protein n=1 Tax=Nocardioides abyssi TaxID=3058370 RepID=A0ABT8ESP1_9ACTN|nr:hypothetical protein [Nocardioides abyssi]MDN4161134.1 hypothetical protein [Nocardioides abyssi]